MDTRDLIAALAADDHPPPRLRARLALALGLGLGASALAFALFWGPRDGLGAVLASPLVAKTLVPAALAALALALAWALIRPAAPRALRALALGAALAGVAALFARAIVQGGAGGLAMALDKPDLWVCLASVPILALAPLAGLLWALSAGAPTRPALSGGAAGLAAGGLAAAIYSLFCTVDMALFVIPAYGTAVLAVAAAGAALGARVLRW